MKTNPLGYLTLLRNISPQNIEAMHESHDLNLIGSRLSRDH